MRAPDALRRSLLHDLGKTTASLRSHGRAADVCNVVGFMSASQIDPDNLADVFIEEPVAVHRAVQAAIAVADSVADWVLG